MSLGLGKFKEVVRKRPREPFWLSRYFWRHITVPFSWLCSLLRIRADHITILSLVVGMLGGLCFCWPTPAAFVAGLLLIQGWSFLDHVDGELARYEIKHLGHRPSLAGPYLDLLVHRWVQPFYHVCMSVAFVRLTGQWEWLLLGWAAGANYFGFAKSQGESLVLRAMVQGTIKADNPVLVELADLSNVLPTKTDEKVSVIRRTFNHLKTVKNWFAFPGCMVLICVVVAVDAGMFRMTFPEVAGMPASASLIYLFLQACVAAGQNLAGTWYVASLLRKLP